MNTIVNSFLLVVASEMGDKTQLLALVLSTRFRRPWTVMAGILVATVLNHALASLVGGWLYAHLSPEILRWGLGICFIAFAFWVLVPDKHEGLSTATSYGAFLTTTIAFFLAEMGDKTQLATVALGAKYGDAVLVTAGTTAGMLVADGLAVFLGDHLLKRVPLARVRLITFFLFLLFGILALTGI